MAINSFPIPTRVVNLQALDQSVADAAASATRAETARDAATVNADAYATTAAGLAATVVGDQFQVVAGDEIIRYRHDAGPVAVEVARYPSVAGVAARTKILVDIEYLAETGATVIVADSGGHVPLAVSEDGAVLLEKAAIGVVDTPTAVFYSTEDEFTSLAYAIADAAGRIGWALLKNGEVIAPGGGVVVSRTVTLIGDSLTQQGGTANYFLNAIAGWPVINLGVGGQDDGQIAGRVGAFAVGVTLSDNTMVPDVNTITAFEGQPIVPFNDANDYFQPLTSGEGAGRSARFVLAGVPGLMARTTASGAGSAETYTFTPDAGRQLPTVVPPKSIAVLEDQSHWANLCIICIGRNSQWDGANADAVMDKLRRMVQRMREVGNDRFVILTIPNGNYPRERRGAADQSRYLYLIELNRRILQEWPRNTFDVRRWLIDEAIGLLGLTPTAQDIIDISDDTTPESVRKPADDIHWKQEIYPLLQTAIINSIIGPRGWAA